MPIIKIVPAGGSAAVDKKLLGNFLEYYNYLAEPPCDKDTFADISGKFGMDQDGALKRYMSLAGYKVYVRDMSVKEIEFMRETVLAGYRAYVLREAGKDAPSGKYGIDVKLADECGKPDPGVPENETWCIFPGSSTRIPVIRL